MKITTLVENNLSSENIESEHGLSLYIEFEEHKILFDTGQTDMLLRNAEKLNVNLQEVDTVIISHGHYDHIGGLIHFLKINQKAKVFLKKEIFEYQYASFRKSVQKNIGYSPDLLNYIDRFVFLGSTCDILEHQLFITAFDKNYELPKGNKTLYKIQNNKLLHDTFQHELIYAINTSNGLVIFSGCAHSGILNIVSTVQRLLPAKKIYAVIGGFHLKDKSEFGETETEIQFIAHELQRISPETIYYTGHCTSEYAYSIMSKILKDKLQKITNFIDIN